MSSLTENVPAMADCNPGVVPQEFNVIIAVPEAETKTKGGIILTTTTSETQQTASMIGRLVAVAPLAGDAIWSTLHKPKAGDAVLFAKYAGVLFTGADGREYRACKDKDIIAVIAEQEA